MSRPVRKQSLLHQGTLFTHVPPSISLVPGESETSAKRRRCAFPPAQDRSNVPGPLESPVLDRPRRACTDPAGPAGPVGPDSTRPPGIRCLARSVMSSPITRRVLRLPSLSTYCSVRYEAYNMYLCQPRAALALHRDSSCGLHDG